MLLVEYDSYENIILANLFVGGLSGKVVNKHVVGSGVISAPPLPGSL